LLQRILDEFQKAEFCRLLVKEFRKAREDGRRQGDLEAEARRLKRSASTLLAVMESGAVGDPREIGQRYDRIQRELASIQAALAASKKQPGARVSVRAMRRRLGLICERVEAIAESPGVERTVRRFLHELVDEIVVEPDGQTASVVLQECALADTPETHGTPGGSAQLRRMLTIDWEVTDYGRKVA